MLICQDCKSHNIIEVDVYQGYFREGEWVRLRSITVHGDPNSETEQYIASCPELSITACAIGISDAVAILNLGEILKGMLGVELLGKHIE